MQGLQIAIAPIGCTRGVFQRQSPYFSVGGVSCTNCMGLLTSFLASSLSFLPIYRSERAGIRKSEKPPPLNTLEMTISFMTYCFPLSLLFTSRAFPKEPSPIFLIRTYLSMSVRRESPHSHHRLHYYFCIWRG